MIPPEYMKKQARYNKPKEEIAYEMKQRQETERKRKIVAEVLWPFLNEYCPSVREAKMFCRVAINDINSTFTRGMAAPLSTLRLEEKFEKEEDKAAISYRAFVDAFKDTPINETLELLDGMPNAIDAGLQFSTKDKLLSELSFKDGTIGVKEELSLEQLIAQTPLCNDFRQLSDGNWIAYSTKMRPDEGRVYSAQGATMKEALINLRELL